MPDPTMPLGTCLATRGCGKPVRHEGGCELAVVRLTFTIPADLWLTSNRQIANRGYKARIVRDLQSLAISAARACDLAPITGPVAVDWTVRYPKGVRRDKGDPTNAHPTTKAFLDALVILEILEDDGPQHVIAETFRRGPNLDVPSLHEITLILTSQEVPW